MIRPTWNVSTEETTNEFLKNDSKLEEIQGTLKTKSQ